MKLQDLIDFIDSYRVPLMIMGAVVLGLCFMAVGMLGGIRAVAKPQEGTRSTVGSAVAILLCGLILGLGPIILGLVVKAAKNDGTVVDLTNIGSAAPHSAARVDDLPDRVL